jgi:hypothetical protein
MMELVSIGSFCPAFQRHPVGRVVGEELEPRLELLRVEQARLVKQELLRGHFAYGADM